jgi:hypothetical protein
MNKRKWFGKGGGKKEEKKSFTLEDWNDRLSRNVGN